MTGRETPVPEIRRYAGMNAIEDFRIRVGVEAVYRFKRLLRGPFTGKGRGSVPLSGGACPPPRLPLNPLPC